MARITKAIVLQINQDGLPKRYVDQFTDDALPEGQQDQSLPTNYDDLSASDKIKWDDFVSMIEANRP